MRPFYGLILLASLFLMATAPVWGQTLESEFLGLSWGADIRNQKGYQLLYEKGDLRF
jgi:hypothetical protein